MTERMEIDTWRAAQRLVGKICGVPVPADPLDIPLDDDGMEMGSRNEHARARYWRHVARPVAIPPVSRT